MILRLLQWRPVQTDVVAWYPDLAVLRRLVRARDWGGVEAYFNGFPPRADRSTAVLLVANTRGSERFLQKAVDTQRDSALARTLLGARFVVLGWKARTRAWAKDVSPAQRRVFIDYLTRAERVLADAVAIDPADSAAWTERITTARALSLGQDEARRRYERAAEHCDTPYRAQVQLVQNLCPKWGGSFAQVHAFAAECLREGKPGSLGGAIAAQAQMEQALNEYYVRDIRQYLARADVRKKIEAAAAQTVLHPDFVPGHGWVTAHSAFAAAFHLGGHIAASRPHLQALGSFADPYGWDQISTKWKELVRLARRDAR
ncbi:hypothetical protein ABZS66_29705 [Dactylosporangium sp. NPDC005572]|uniref:hypothetical protein n=1 Tax=Dactylosporangium sp. NPDC005572 TaxID=3156889 RepID=UPI0033B4004D